MRDETRNKRKPKKIKVALKPYTLIQRAVEEGINYGLNRSYKHTDTPTRDYMEDQIDVAVMNELCEIIDFGDEL
jgi:hypothetical protein